MYDFETVIDRRGTGSEKWDLIPGSMGEGSGDVIALSVADMEFRTAPEITRALVKAAETGLYGYTGPTERYYDAVCGWMRRRHGWEIQKDWVCLSPGVVPAVFTAVRALTRPGDRVILQRPVYYPFTRAVERSGCTVLDNALLLRDGRYEMNFDDLERKARDPRAKALILCSPHNPVGRVWTREELTRLGEICLRNGVTVISDEIHFDFVFPGSEHTVFASISEEFARNCMVMTAPSKTFNLAGLQISNIMIPDPGLRSRFCIAAENIASGDTNYFSYAACEAAYTQGEAWLGELLARLRENRDGTVRFLAENLPRLRPFPLEGTYLMWLDCRPLGMGPKELEAFLRGKARLFFDEGYLFGEEGAGFERINLACPPSVLCESLERLKRAVDAL